ncbi:MAG: hypothetical protein ACYCY5_00395, partial [Sulfuricella sp.]
KKRQFFCHRATEKWGSQGWVALPPNSQNMSQPLREALMVSDTKQSLNIQIQRRSEASSLQCHL